MLYLDFENSKSQIANRLSKICQAYWGKEDDSAKRNLAIRYGSELPAENQFFSVLLLMFLPPDFLRVLPRFE